MVEVPEYLLKRAQAARAKAEAAKSAIAQAGDSQLDKKAAAGMSASGMPVNAASSSGGSQATGISSTLSSSSANISADPPGTLGGMTGPVGHTQRLLTVVKSGSIQDVKSKPQDKVHVWPHLLAIEFVSALVITAFTLIFAMFVNAPLLQLANFNQTPNPSKAPWYFLGLQELLTLFHPMVAGVTIPGVALILLMVAPYVDKNPSNAPEDRKFAISLMTVHLMFWAVLVIIGSFFRGPGFNFIFPWQSGLFFEL